MSTTSPMTLDDLIDTLATANPALVLLRGFDSPHGSRATNFHPALGFEPARRITISAMLAAARSAKGTKVISRGGEFTVTGSTPCWLDFTGMTAGLEITPELVADYIAAGSVPSPAEPQAATPNQKDPNGIATLTWQPADTDQPETVTIDMPADWIVELQRLIDARHNFGDAVAWIPTRDDAGAYTPRLFRLARITATAGGPVTTQAEHTPLDDPTRRAHLLEAAEAITRLQDQMDQEIRAEYGELDRDTEVEGAATRRMADMLRELAGTATPAASEPTMPSTPFNATQSRRPS